MPRITPWPDAAAQTQGLALVRTPGSGDTWSEEESWLQQLLSGAASGSGFLCLCFGFIICKVGLLAAPES